MNREQARQEIKASWEEILRQITRPAKNKVNGRTSYICPLCNHGANGDGLTVDPTSKDGQGLKCFGSCGFSGDIIDLIGEDEGITNYPEKLRRAGEILGIEIDESQTPARRQREEQKEDPTKSLIPLYREAGSHLTETDYHQRRGISEETARRYNLGYIANWRHTKAPNAPATPRLIIPVSEYSYIAIDARTNIPEGQKRYRKSKEKSIERPTWTFNKKALKEAKKPIVIVEGEIDALSIIEAGGEAAAIGSVAYINNFVEEIRRERPKQPLIIALDNDTAGREAALKLEAEIKKLRISCYRAENYLYGIHKDANETLTADREGLTQRIATATAEPEELTRLEYISTCSTSAHIQAFIDGIRDSANTPATPTGFSALDEELDGGLYEGLYFVGGITSLGKTTLVMQIADQIAASGRDILIFSLEMARTELMSKCISRLTLLEVLQNNGNTANAKTARGITAGARYQYYNQTEIEIIQKAISSYGEIARNIYIHEGIGNIGVTQVREIIERHIQATGNSPVVIVDYLQILSPYNIRATDKQNTDKNVLEMKRISRDYKIPVIGVSSFNRDNYKAAVDLSAFKESGNIEYGADVLIGLQLAGAGEKDFDGNKAKQENPRKIELVILKNRNGRTGGKIAFEYYPLFNYFKEKGVVIE